MSLPDFHNDYFKLFDLPTSFALDGAQLSERYRKLQGELHPDRYASKSPQEQRLAVQYSALVNEAYATLRKPLGRALYLLELSGVSEQEVARQQIDGGFLIMQMELREKLESLPGLVDPDPVLEHVLEEIEGDIADQRRQFQSAYDDGDLSGAAMACVKMQYLEKLQLEAEQLESDLMDDE
ncbi:MAG: Fe-S protein assembly co-chaperone HscB [Halioglobus sp.]